MPPRHPLLLAACAAALALPAAAQTIKPGLWEVTNNLGDPSGQVQGAMAELQRQMARMPPDQRKMMEQMMAQNGVQMSPDTGGLVARICVTPDMVRNGELPVSQDGNCSQSHSPVSGGKMNFTFNCPGTRTSGSGEVTFRSDTSYTLKAQVLRGGNPTPVTVDSDARWLGADCGVVRPVALPK
ncbi:DUF3617 domain-containing protein [Massilia terrae]|uniref:DUF3617 domain-containing protein n=1 Tax=Massilia terrae TaxID=1811224 RepID=A0ABT2D4G6_9BURK|nr:DUF3617 domain-containing protein [Massilia terrae]MCS0660233.1 DUF3617 domain-containing protein [Massilia terrae]